MKRIDDSDGARLLRGALAGFVAGVVASFAMDGFQSVVSTLSPDDGAGGHDEPATQKAADGIGRALTGEAVADSAKPLAGQAIHYALGIGLGVAYGIAAEFRPDVTAGRGSAFGLGTATVLDEAAVPALGLGAPPWKAGAAANLYSYASHLVFGGAAEFVRGRVSSSLKPAAS